MDANEAKELRSVATFESWYSDQEVRFNRILSHAVNLANAALNEDGIQFLPILSRVKSLESAKAKYLRKAQSADYEMTDIIGLRVVVLLDNDIDLAGTALRKVFEVDEGNCIDKRKLARVDSVGYRSLHLVATLGDDRSKLPEYHGICGIKFEIQIRTALQHTWAEIEHKRNYKGKFALPVELQRRLMVLSGTLELIDSEFSRISLEADEYRRRVEASDQDVDDDELSFISLKSAIEVSIHRLTPEIFIRLNEETADVLVSELSAFGIKNVGELKAFLSGEKFEKLVRCSIHDRSIHGIGLVRDAMICEDVHKYFERSFQNHFGAMEAENLNYLREISGEPDIERIVQSHGVVFF